MKSLKILVIVIVIIVSNNVISFGDDIQKEYKNITLYDGEEVKVSCSLTGNGYRYDVLFSDGNNYIRDLSFSGNSSSSCSLSLSIEQMEKADEAIAIHVKKYGLPKKPKKPKDAGSILFTLFLIIVGFVNVIAPKVSWYLKDGWKFRDAEPSELSLMVGRTLGAILIFIGVIRLFI